MLLQISTLKFWINLEPLDYFHLIGMARGGRSEAVSKKEEIFGDLEEIAFNTEISAQVYMLAHELYSQADHLLKKSSSEEIILLVPGLGHQVNGLQDDSPTQLEAIRRARGLICVHAVALAKEALQWRYGAIGRARAESLRIHLQDKNHLIYKFVWKVCFRTLRNWFIGLTDKSALKPSLQKVETLFNLKAALADVLSDIDKASIPNLD